MNIHWTNQLNSIEKTMWFRFFKINKSIELYWYNQWNSIEKKQWNPIEINQCNSIAMNLEIAYIEVQDFRLKPWTWRLTWRSPISKFRASVWNPELGDCLSRSSRFQDEALNLEIAYLEVNPELGDCLSRSSGLQRETLNFEIAYQLVEPGAKKPGTRR